MSDEPVDDIQEVPSMTPDFQTELAQQLNKLVPEAISDGKVDVKKLQELLDTDTTDDSERFGLFWPGKKRAMRAAQEPTTATLKPVKEESKDWDTTENIFIEGDNLEVLKILQKNYHNKIKMIYIDPPYNTGRDFVYPDNFKEGLASYLEFTNQVDEGGKKVTTNSDTDGRYHSNWLNMMYPRLKLARNLLTEDGLIFISIDDNEVAQLRKICDEIFGEDNFLAQIVWEKRYGRSNDAKLFANNIDYLIAYRRSSQLRILREPRDEAKDSIYKNIDNDPRGPWTSVSFVSQRTLDERPNLTYALKNPFTGEEVRHESNAWKYNEAKYNELAADNRFWWGKDGKQKYPRIKRFLNELSEGMVPVNLWKAQETGTGDIGTREVEALIGKDIFDYPKPTTMLKRVLAVGTNANDRHVILDFFSGSGSMGHAVMEQNAIDDGNRIHIQVQLPEPTDVKSQAYKSGYKNIADISKERLRRASDKIKQDYIEKIAGRETPLDIGFKVYKLTDSNFTKWQSASETDNDSLQQHLLEIRESSNDAASEEELLTEVLLKQGISLTAKATHEDISGLSIWNIGDTTVLAYLNENTKPSLDQLRAVADTQPAKIIILEDCFKGDDELKTNLAQICKTNKIELWTV
ncbi:MAG: adenine-specific DNA-methyltransferase [Patescibacteria group bacterium]|nr:adenine-specific DNA-methyltransferase [Patescibacteria group bacterium]